IMGLQTGRLKERENQALARERETELLYQFSAQLVSEMNAVELARVLAEKIASKVNAISLLLFLPDDNGKLSVIGAPASLGQKSQSLANWVYLNAKAVGLPFNEGLEPAEWPISVTHDQTGLPGKRSDIAIPLTTATKQVGVLYVSERKNGGNYTLTDARLLVMIANQTAAFLERQQLQALAVQADALRESDHLKSTFVSSVSHDLKTPLASIKATVTNLLEKDFRWDEKTVRHELGAIKIDLDKLGNNIGSLIDLSRLESSAWKPKKEWFTPGEIVGSTLNLFAEKQRARITLALPDNLPEIPVDFDQLSRVLGNLLDNALTYGGEDGRVKIGAEEEKNEVRLWVEDEGPGVPPEERELIFEKFYRGRYAAKSPSGTGLGLAIAREIVKTHGGRIWIEDVLPHGARFTLALPKAGVKQ
ncbi:MAG: ATP-binding protein, partial [Candidatus Margulisiibacteriota bacterium]